MMYFMSKGWIHYKRGGATKIPRPGRNLSMHRLPVRYSIENTATTAGKFAHFAECGSGYSVGHDRIWELLSGNTLFLNQITCRSDHFQPYSENPTERREKNDQDRCWTRAAHISMLMLDERRTKGWALLCLPFLGTATIPKTLR